MTTQIDFQRHLQIRDRIRSTLEALKAEGITSSELIECVGNELHLLKLQDERDFKAMNPEEWNPDRACEEMAELFNQADEITSQPHYQVPDDSAAVLDGPGADASKTTDKQSQGMN